MQPSKYIIRESIPCYAVDGNKNLRATAFMDYAQELAYLGATSLGFGYDTLIQHNTAWVLARFHIKFLRPVQWRENVEIQTWHKGLNGIYFMRDFNLVGEDGESSVVGTSSWIVLDTKERAFVKTERIMEMVPEETAIHEDAIEKPCGKVIIPRSATPEKVGEHVVNFTDMDFLGHTNNVRYAAWSLEAAGSETTSVRPLRELFINFNKETHAGDTIEFFRHVSDNEETGERTVTVEGKVEGVQSFCCKLVF